MRQYKKRTAALIFLLVAAFLADIFAGPGTFSLEFEELYDIIIKIRLPRAFTSLVAGGTFALCGAVFQSLFRNPIASPFTLGTAGGASFGVTVLISFFPVAGTAGIFLTPAAAFTGSLLSVGIVYSASSGRRSFNPNTMILTGVVINFLFSGLILLVQYVTDQANVVRITRWTMGSIEITDTLSLVITFMVFAAGSVLLYGYRNELNLLSFGDEISVARGVNTVRTRKSLFLISSVMISSVVSVTGPIAFIGIIAPHISASFFGKNYRNLLPSSLITGGILLLTGDIISRTAMYPVEIPVGIITSIAGAVFFAVILHRNN